MWAARCGLLVGSVALVGLSGGHRANRTSVASASWPHEPVGLTVISDQLWNGPLPPANVFQGNNAWTYYPERGAHADIVTDRGDPRGPRTVLRYTFPAAYLGDGRATDILVCSLPPASKLYVGFWWRISDPWTQNPSGGSKLAYLNTGDAAHHALNNYFILLDVNLVRNGQYGISLTDNTIGHVYLPNVTTTYVPVGTWHQIEIYAEMSGVLTWWIDGTLNGQYTNAVFRNTGFDWFEFEPIWGGVSDIAKRQTEYQWIGPTHISRGP